MLYEFERELFEDVKVHFETTKKFFYAYVDRFNIEEADARILKSTFDAAITDAIFIEQYKKYL